MHREENMAAKVREAQQRLRKILLTVIKNNLKFITEYPELEETHQHYPVQLLGLHRHPTIPPKSIVQTLICGNI